MDDQRLENDLKPASKKSFMTAGPVLHYSHKNVNRCFFLAALVFLVGCSFWSKISSGSFFSFNLDSLLSVNFWNLGVSVSNGLSIFDYPWLIVVFGLLMGLISIIPVLVSQLMSFSYSLVFILGVFFLANLGGLSLSLLISCFAVACRPLRFRSRFTAVVLCTAPQLIYWGFWGGASGGVVGPIEWGISFTPWIAAWLTGLWIAGLVILIGHYTRYRPGFVWGVSLVVLAGAVFLFDKSIGFDELDYQLYVARNNPEHVNEFRDHSISGALDATINNPNVLKYFSDFFFYPTDPASLRQALKKEIRSKLSGDTWPNWFMVTPELRYQLKKQELFGEYEKFIKSRPNSSRVPIALYWMGLLSEYSPDIKRLEEDEVLSFYSDYPFERSSQIWYRLYRDFPESPESIEARWRIAKHWSGNGRFDLALRVSKEAEEMVEKTLASLEQEKISDKSEWFSFNLRSQTVMSVSKLRELKVRLGLLEMQIGLENRGKDSDSKRRLAKFVMLNRHSFDYEAYLSGLLGQMEQNDPLRDNILLSQALLIKNGERCSESLINLHKKYPGRDGGMRALYELGRLRISFYQKETDLEQKKICLVKARDTLTEFLHNYPESIFNCQVKEILNGLPVIK